MNQSSHPTVDRQGEAVAAAPGPGPEGRVLVIDDDEAVGLVLSRVMTRLGYAAEITCDGPSGLAHFDANPDAYCLVLLDFKLPGMDSGTVYRRIRERRADLPVVLMSGYNRQEALEKSAGLEFAGFLHKPFTMDSLAAALRLAAAR